MSKIHEVRMKVRAELEVPPALRRFGSGWISGVLGLVLGVGGLLLVISMLFPGVLTLPESEPLRTSHWYRLGLHVLLLTAFLLSALSLALRKERTLGTCGVAVTILAAVIGGSQTTAVVA